MFCGLDFLLGPPSVRPGESSPRKSHGRWAARYRNGLGCPALQTVSRRLGAKNVVTTAVAKVADWESAMNCWLSRRTNSAWSRRLTKRRIKVRRSAAVAATEVPCPETSASNRREIRPVAQLDA